MKTVDSLEHDVPLYAPCRKLAFNAPLGWLKQGWQDFRQAPWQSLTYGTIFTVIGWALVYFAWSYQSNFIYALFTSFVLVGPMLTFGLYDISQQLEQKRTPTFGHERWKAFHEMGHELMFALLLSLVFMILLILISAVMDTGTVSGQQAISAAAPASDAAVLLTAGIFAGLLFCSSIFGLPMILDKDTSAITGIITSLHAVWRNKSVIALWALLILALTAVGFATALIGYVVIVPVLGYATWHAYREAIITK